MKKLLIVLLILRCVNSYCQEYDVFIAKDVVKMTVFSGCEKFTSNEDLMNCLSSNISKTIAKGVDPKIDDFTPFRVTELSSKIQFIISKEGKIINLTYVEGNPFLSEIAIAAIEKHGEGFTLEPALMENNKPVNLVFQLPIRIQFYTTWNKENEIFESLGAKEIVYATMNDNDEKYEIRLKKDLTFSVYNLKNNQEEFLGNVPNWLEFKNMEPFAKYVNEFLAEQQWELMTEGNLDEETYRIYRWSYELEYVRVYKVVNGEEELVLKSNRFSKFQKSPYVKLLYRN